MFTLRQNYSDTKMINRIYTGSDELNIAIAEFSKDPSEEKYFAVIAALADAYDLGDRFFVASAGDVFQSVREDGQDYLVMFTDLEEAEIGPDTDLAVLDLEELIGNILSDDEISGIIIDPFSDMVLVDRDALSVIRSMALAGPLEDVRVDMTDMTPEEMLKFADAVRRGEDHYVADKVKACAIYEEILERTYNEDGDQAGTSDADRIRARAETGLAELIIEGDIYYKDETEARLLLADAAEMLDTDAMIALGSLEERDGNHIGAAAMYHKAAILGNSRGLLEFGRLLMYGLGIEKDVNFARECFTKAAADGLGDAYYYLGQIEEKGLEGDSDGEKAREYYDLGSELGSLKCRDTDPDLLGGTFPDTWGTKKEEKEDEDNYVFDFSGGVGKMRS